MQGNDKLTMVYWFFYQFVYFCVFVSLTACAAKYCIYKMQIKSQATDASNVIHLNAAAPRRVTHILNLRSFQCLLRFRLFSPAHSDISPLFIHKYADRGDEKWLGGEGEGGTPYLQTCDDNA